MSYYFSTTITGNFEDTVQKTTEALKKEGFGVLTDIDARIVQYQPAERYPGPLAVQGDGTTLVSEIKIAPNFPHQILDQLFGEDHVVNVIPDGAQVSYKPKEYGNRNNRRHKVDY